MKFPHRRTQADGDHVIAVITKYKCSSKPNVFPFVQQEGTNVSEIFLLLGHVGRLLNVRTDCAGSWRDFFSYLI